jgi:ABC-2 type transport system permease protein
MRGIVAHLVLTLRLNFRARQALVYGYLVPIFFLIAFGSVFHSSIPPLLHEMGQLVTITILGGACFGMPTAMVGERERGVWRRYRLLPASSASLIISTMVARYIILLLAVLMQFGLAWCLYRTPFPARPLQELVAFTAVSFAFLGLGLIIAMLAGAVPAVQALGQAIFLPMIMIGGVGVPLRTLPAWAQQVAGFLPGRYAVEALDACYQPDGPGLGGARFALAALIVIGAAACISASRMFRWDAGRAPARRASVWIALALAAWAGVGLVAWQRGHLKPVLPPVSDSSAAWESITQAQIKSIDFKDLPDESGIVAPVAPGLDRLPEAAQKRALALRYRLMNWAPGLIPDPLQRTRNLLAAAATYDVLENPDEASMGYLVLETIRQRTAGDKLEKILTYIIVNPGQGLVVTTVPELGSRGEISEGECRERVVLYAKRLLKYLVSPSSSTAP